MTADWRDETREFYSERGLGSRLGAGEHPGLIVIDMSIPFCDVSYKVGCDQSETLAAIATLLEHTRARSVPTWFTTIAYRPDGGDAGMFGRKVPALLELQLDDPNAMTIHPAIAPVEGEVVFNKKYASAFFETELPSQLVTAGVDTLILVGTSTSGCVRAAAVDGISSGYRILVPAECVSDRARGPHEAALFDIDSKYGDVLPLADVIDYVDGLHADPRERRLAAAGAR